jgi:hypothetical protein
VQTTARDFTSCAQCTVIGVILWQAVRSKRQGNVRQLTFPQWGVSTPLRERWPKKDILKNVKVQCLCFVCWHYYIYILSFVCLLLFCLIK